MTFVTWKTVERLPGPALYEGWLSHSIWKGLYLIGTKNTPPTVRVPIARHLAKQKKSHWMHLFNVGLLTATCYSPFPAEGARIITTSGNPLSLEALRSTPLAANLYVAMTGLSFPHINKLSGTSWHVKKAEWLFWLMWLRFITLGVGFIKQ